MGTFPLATTQEGGTKAQQWRGTLKTAPGVVRTILRSGRVVTQIENVIDHSTDAAMRDPGLRHRMEIKNSGI